MRRIEWNEHISRMSPCRLVRLVRDGTECDIQRTEQWVLRRGGKYGMSISAECHSVGLYALLEMEQNVIYKGLNSRY